MAQPALTNMQKIATLLLSLGAERSAEILEYLDPDQMKRIAQEIASMGKVPNQTRRAVLREFRSLINAEEQRHAGMNFAEQVLDKALGADSAHQILRQIKPAVSMPSPPYLATVTPGRAAELLSGEPQHIAALVLVALPADIAAAILEALPAALQPLIALQVAKTSPPSPEVTVQLERALRAKAARYQREEQISGRIALAEILHEVGPDMATVTDNAPPMPAPAPEKRESSDPAPLTFFDLASFAPPALHRALQQVETPVLCLALRGADLPLREHLLAALPFSRRMMVQSRLKMKHACRLRDIAEAQDQVVLAAQTTAQETPTSQKEPVHA